MREHRIDGAVLCIDTWLGGLEHLLWENEWNIRPFCRHGYPTLFYQFLANVMREGLQDFIVPLPTTSLIGARWMRKKGLVADVIYIDGSHDEEDVYNDLKEFWRVLRPGGVMCGDDFSIVWYSVICAVNRFAKECALWAIGH
jgi:Methyltransferase domain